MICENRCPACGRDEFVVHSSEYVADGEYNRESRQCGFVNCQATWVDHIYRGNDIMRTGEVIQRFLCQVRRSEGA